MARVRTVWFQKNTQQGVFMKVASLPAINRNGPVQVITENEYPQKNENLFIVGKTVVGGKEVVG